MRSGTRLCEIAPSNFHFYSSSYYYYGYYCYKNRSKRYFKRELLSADSLHKHPQWLPAGSLLGDGNSIQPPHMDGTNPIKHSAQLLGLWVSIYALGILRLMSNAAPSRSTKPQVQTVITKREPSLGRYQSSKTGRQLVRLQVRVSQAPNSTQFCRKQDWLRSGSLERRQSSE